MTKPPRSTLPKLPHEALLEQIEAMKPLGPILKATGGDVAESWARVEEQKAAFERHQENVGYFTKAYAPLGWTPFDQFSLEIMEALRERSLAEGEALLTQHFLEAGGLKLFDLRMRRNAYAPWRDISERAFERIRADDYLSAIPLLFIVIDGVCQHHTQKSAFGGAADQGVFDTLTTAPNGLAHALALAGRTRKKLSTEPLDTPYRNGILHGRDVNFGHAIVAAKAVNLLRATIDYLDRRNDEEERIAKAEKDQRPADWAVIFAERDRTRAFREAFDAWTARAPREGVFVTHENASGLNESSPESAAVALLKAMSTGNFGKMSERTLDYTKRTPAKWAGDLRRDYSELRLEKWSLGWLNDTAAAASEMCAIVSGQWKGRPWSGRVEMRLLHLDEDNDPLPRGWTGGRWVVVPSALSEMWRLAYSAISPTIRLAFLVHC